MGTPAKSFPRHPQGGVSRQRLQSGSATPGAKAGFTLEGIGPLPTSPSPPCYVCCCKRALRKKNPKSSTTEQGVRQRAQGIGQGASKRCLAWQGGAGLTSKTKKHFLEWKPVYLKHETSSLLGHISLPPSAGEGRERLLPANLALPEAVSNRDKPGLQGNRDTPPVC